jgi:hypothetical protein
MFEKDSFEIQARVKQGIESERDVETLQANVIGLKDRERSLQRQLEARN